MPVSGSYHVADAAGLLWSLHPAFARAPEPSFTWATAASRSGCRCWQGEVKAAATLVRLWSFETGPSVQTVGRDGIASTLFTPTGSRPALPPLSSSAARTVARKPSPPRRWRWPGIPRWRWGTLRSPDFRSACAPFRWSTSPALCTGCARSRWQGRRVVLIGGSRGAEGALLVASYEPHLFDAVVADSPTS